MSELHELARTPVEFDTRLADLYEQAEKIEAQLERTVNQMHNLAGDRRSVGRHRLWRRTYAEVLETVQIQSRQAEGRMREEAAAILEAERRWNHERGQVLMQIHLMDEVYAQAPWSRFFPCANRDGHIHSSLRGCSSVYRTTLMKWRPGLSGLTVAAAVKDLGEALCTFCFHDAPSDWKAKTLGQVKDERTRAEREAAQAAKLEAKYVKALRPGSEEFPCGGDWISTVYAAKEVLRKEVEYRDFFGHGRHSRHAEYVRGAAQAAELLLKRETAKPGTGATQEQLDQIIDRAVKRNIRNGARLNPDGSVKA